jgi:glc operon protein GlcG
MNYIFISILFLLTHSAFSAEKATELNLDYAQKIAAKAAACGLKNKWKLSIAIVNSEGNLLYFQRGDGSYLGSIDAAIDKAKSANAFQRPTKAFVDGLKDGRTGLVTIKNIVGIEGGLPIQFGDKHVGGIGISGAKATEDEQCAKIALEN